MGKTRGQRLLACQAPKVICSKAHYHIPFAVNVALHDAWSLLKRDYFQRNFLRDHIAGDHRVSDRLPGHDDAEYREAYALSHIRDPRKRAEANIMKHYLKEIGELGMEHAHERHIARMHAYNALAEHTNPGSGEWDAQHARNLSNHPILSAGPESAKWFKDNGLKHVEDLWEHNARHDVSSWVSDGPHRNYDFSNFPYHDAQQRNMPPAGNPFDNLRY